MSKSLISDETKDYQGTEQKEKKVDEVNEGKVGTVEKEQNVNPFESKNLIVKGQTIKPGEKIPN